MSVHKPQNALFGIYSEEMVSKHSISMPPSKRNIKSGLGLGSGLGSLASRVPYKKPHSNLGAIKPTFNIPSFCDEKENFCPVTSLYVGSGGENAIQKKAPLGASSQQSNISLIGFGRKGVFEDNENPIKPNKPSSRTPLSSKPIVSSSTPSSSEPTKKINKKIKSTIQTSSSSNGVSTGTNIIKEFPWDQFPELKKLVDSIDQKKTRREARMNAKKVEKKAEKKIEMQSMEKNTSNLLSSIGADSNSPGIITTSSSEGAELRQNLASVTPTIHVKTGLELVEKLSLDNPETWNKIPSNILPSRTSISLDEEIALCDKKAKDLTQSPLAEVTQAYTGNGDFRVSK
jgi:hypothetical protein